MSLLKDADENVHQKLPRKTTSIHSGHYYLFFLQNQKRKLFSIHFEERNYTYPINKINIMERIFTDFKHNNRNDPNILNRI